MPVLRYFVFVGGALLVLLLALSAELPAPTPAGPIAAGNDLPAIRIRSDRKLPERVVIDTTLPTVTPPATMTAEAAPVLSASALAEMSAKARVRETFAQLVPSEAKAATKRVESRPPPKRRIARARPPAPPMMLVAQQPRFGFFNNMW